MKLIFCNCIFVLFFTIIGAKSLNSVSLPTGGRIVGGENAAIEDFPYQVSILLYNSPWCGGTILNEKIILTASHCVRGISTSKFLVKAGSIYPDKGDTRNVSKKFVHEQYNPNTIDYDVALLVLSESLEFSEKIQPIALPEEHEFLEATEGVNITGWGTVTEGGFAAPVLQKIENIPVVDQTECIKMYASMNPVTPRMLCAGYIKGGYDHCNGDSGGPVVSNGKIHGIVSWALGCARPDFPGVNTRVTAVREWIRSKVNL